MSIPNIDSALNTIKEDFITRIKHQLLISGDARITIPSVLKAETEFLRELKQQLKDSGWDVVQDDSNLDVSHPNLSS